jgi:hypothetical protein
LYHGASTEEGAETALPPDREVLEMLLVVTARKLDFLGAVSERMDQEMADGLGPQDKGQLEADLAQIVGGMTPLLFLSRRELQTKVIDLRTQLQDLRLEEIWKAFSKRVVKKFPSLGTSLSTH